MIFHDEPRRYSKRGKRWAHVFSLDVDELKGFGRRYRLKRFDGRPWPHYDVTEEELWTLKWAMAWRKEPLPTQLTRAELRPIMKMMRESHGKR